MTMQLNKRDVRQRAYLERARSARGFARMLMPVAFLVLGTAIWQDPELGPILADGLDEIRPTAASYLVDTPLEDVLGPALGTDELVQDLGTEERVARLSAADTSVPGN